MTFREWGYDKTELRPMVGGELLARDQHVRFETKEKIRRGSLITVDEDGTARAAGEGDPPIGFALCETKRDGSGRRVVDVNMAVTVVEPDPAADFERIAQQGLARVRKADAAWRRAHRKRRNKQRRR